MIAALMTATNLGARVTGWGFVVFTLGSLGWIVVGLGAGQTSLVVTNIFLTLVNAVGVWRWLGRQARYEAVGKAAEVESTAREAPSVFAATAIVGRKIVGEDGTILAEAVEAIIGCHSGAISHIVVRHGGVGGVGESVAALDVGDVRFDGDVITTGLTAEAIRSRPIAADGDWHSLLVAAPQPI